MRGTCHHSISDERDGGDLLQMSAIEVRVGRQGRIVIPAAFRESLALRPGDPLVATIDDGRLVLERREAVLARVRRRFQSIPPGVSLADELIQERRAEALREAGP